MKKVHLLFLALVCFVLTPVVLNGQEFPIAVGPDTTFAAGAVYGGSNGMVAILGDNFSQYSVTAQLIGAGGTLIGSRISLGSYGIFPGPNILFDGDNYFLIWLDFNGNLKGQFINTSGTLVGNSFTIATNVSTQRPESIDFCLGGNNILVVFTKTNDYLYGQFVSKNGSLIGNQFQISFTHAREISIAYDNTNFLVTWVEIIPSTDKDIYGQFVSNSGSLVGMNFLIDGGPYFSDNPLDIAFDGNRYFLVYHEAESVMHNWFIAGKFITKSGIIQETITICDTSLGPFIASVAFDGSNYLVTWTQFSDLTFRGKFYNVSGNPIGSDFLIMNASSGKVPVGGVGYGGGLYLAVATKIDSNFSNGDVYGRFISPVTAVNDKNNPILENFRLSQNYPNPFNPSTTIVFSLPSGSLVSLKVFDFIGREVAILYSGELPAGTYEQRWDAANLPSGIYFYRLQAGSFSETKKLVLLK